MTRIELDELAELRSGVAFPLALQGRTSGDYLFAKVGDISRCARSGQAVLESGEHYVDAVDLVTLKSQPLPPGAILFAKIGEAIRANHRVLAGVECLVDNNVMAVVLDESRCRAKYMYHFLRTVDFYALADRTTVPSLRKSRLGSLRIPVPPLSEQARIADILDRAEALLTKRRVALERLDELGQAMFLEMFGDPVTNPKGWGTTALGEIGHITTGNTPSREDAANFGDEIEWIKSDNIESSATFLSKAAEGLSARGRQAAREVPAGSVLVTCIAGSPSRIGECAIADRPVCFNQQINAVSPVKFDFWCLFYLLRLAKRLIQAAATEGMKGIVSKSKFSAIRLPVLPLDLQQSFADRIAVLERLKAHHRASLAEMEALFASLQHRAFRGEL